jgi:peptidoglycan/xylan/chitin deacetylase (PgdA/CDA1 family)
MRDIPIVRTTCFAPNGVTIFSAGHWRSSTRGAGMGLSRRRFLGGAALAAGGAVGGALGVPMARRALALDRPDLGGGYASAADVVAAAHSPSTTITYFVQTDEPVVAFTFDDGPGPRWTPTVLDALDEWQVPATFFMVGRNLARHADLVRGRLDRHEVGNHTWSHADLATLDRKRVMRELTRGHDAIERVTGRAPTLLRPPYGHLGGSTVLAADSLHYDIVLWSHQMREKAFQHDRPGQVRDIVDNVGPGSIVLAHDVGPSRRLVALRGLGEMFAGLKARGFRFVTVSELMTLGRAGPARS